MKINMNKHMNRLLKSLSGICVTLALSGVLAVVAPVSAQVNPPVREYTNPDEMVTLAAETTFPQALQILGGFSRRFAEKPLIDRSNRTGTIGLSIPYMHWRQALEYIATANNLVIMEYPQSIEVLIRPIDSPRVDTTRIAPTIKVQPVQISRQTNMKAEFIPDLFTREIEISAIFFEGNRRVLREIGVDWSVINDGIVSVKSLNAGGVTLENFVIGVTPDLGSSTDWEVSALISALEASNAGQILSSPRIKVLDGQVGDVQVGQDISIKQRDFAGNVTDEFYKTGTILTVTPNVISYSDTTFILLNITAGRSTGQPDPVSTIINKQQASTQVLLYSGESTVVAGLYETEESIIRRGIPFLKDLPPWFFGLRYIFGYNSKDYREKELIVVIKATLVPTMHERFNRKLNPMEEELNRGRNVIREVNLRRLKD
jgi:general secretion pathway protein D